LTSPRTLIAAAIKDRPAFDIIAASDEPGTFTGDLLTIWRALGEYYVRDESVESCCVDNLRALVLEGVANPKGRKRLVEALDEVGAIDASPGNVREGIRIAARERIGTKLAVALSARKAREEVDQLIGKWQETFVADEGDKELTYGEALRSRLDVKGRLEVRPLALNKSLGGGVLPGHNIILFGRPERGKSAMAVTMAVGFARRGHKVLYFCNEDPAADLMVRAITAMTKKPREAAGGEALISALHNGLGNLKFIDIAPGSLAEIEGHIRRNKPAVIVVDQLRNIHAGKTENMTQRLDTVAQGVRALAKRYGLVAVSVTQAGDSGRDKSILDDGDIDSSNTGIPAAADVLIGIGASAAQVANGSLTLALCKNKVTGRHDVINVTLDPITSLVRSAE
jgi:archaellum biogenesis ATPase FlaH